MEITLTKYNYTIKHKKINPSFVSETQAKMCKCSWHITLEWSECDGKINDLAAKRPKTIPTYEVRNA